MKKSKLLLSLTLLLFSSVYLTAQNMNAELSASATNVQSAVSKFKSISQPIETDPSFAELDRQVRRYSYTDSTVTRAEINRAVSNVPAILWGLGGGAAYFGANALLFGGLDNAGFPGLILSSAGAIVIGAIVNASKREKARQRILARKNRKAIK